MHHYKKLRLAAIFLPSFGLDGPCLGRWCGLLPPSPPRLRDRGESTLPGETGAVSYRQPAFLVSQSESRSVPKKFRSGVLTPKRSTPSGSRCSATQQPSPPATDMKLVLSVRGGAQHEKPCSLCCL